MSADAFWLDLRADMVDANYAAEHLRLHDLHAVADEFGIDISGGD